MLRTQDDWGNYSVVNFDTVVEAIARVRSHVGYVCCIYNCACVGYIYPCYIHIIV